MLPPAPALFSTTTGWPRFSPSFFAMMREAVSVPPPGAKPTTIEIARDGYGAWASAAPANNAVTATPRSFFISVCLCSGILDHARPHFRVLRDERGEILRRFRARRLGSAMCEHAADRGIGHRNRGGVEHAPDDFARGSRGE